MLHLKYSLFDLLSSFITHCHILIQSTTIPRGKPKTTPLHFCIVFRLGEEHFPNSRYVHLFRCVDLWKPNRFLIEKLI